MTDFHIEACAAHQRHIDELGAELDRLRAEVAERDKLLSTIATRLQVAGGAFPTLIDAINAILAKHKPEP